MSSDSRVFVIQIDTIYKHDNADTLSIVDVFGGYPCIIRTGDFKVGDLAAYIPVDMLVPDRPEFAFLRSPKSKAGESIRIKAKRLRGVFSMGVLIPSPPGSCIGEDVTDQLGITKWEPEEISTHNVSRPGGKFLPGNAENNPGFLPAYTDIENLRKFKTILEGQDVVATEKIHGANAGFVYHRDGLWIRSRRQFKKPEGGGIWAEVAKLYKLEETLRQACPGIAIFGEVYGQVQDLTYGFGNSVDLVVFDAMDVNTKRYLNYSELFDLVEKINSLGERQLKTVPVLYQGMYNYEELAKLAEGVSVLGNGLHVREGFVVKPLIEQWHPKLGRVILKLAGEGYLTR